MAGTGPGARAQRVVAVVLLLVLGILSLPVTAFFLDGQSTENYILPVELLAMAIVGAGVGYLLPGLAGEGATRRHGAWIGAGVGFVAALVGLVLFFLLISGFDGA